MNGGEPRILVVVPFYNNGRTVASVVSEITALVGRFLSSMTGPRTADPIP